MLHRWTVKCCVFCVIILFSKLFGCWPPIGAITLYNNCYSTSWVKAFCVFKQNYQTYRAAYGPYSHNIIIKKQTNKTFALYQYRRSFDRNSWWRTLFYTAQSHLYIEVNTHNNNNTNLAFSCYSSSSSSSSSRRA